MYVYCHYFTPIRRGGYDACRHLVSIIGWENEMIGVTRSIHMVAKGCIVTRMQPAEGDSSTGIGGNRDVVRRSRPLRSKADCNLTSWISIWNCPVTTLWGGYHLNSRCDGWTPSIYPHVPSRCAYRHAATERSHLECLRPECPHACCLASSVTMYCPAHSMCPWTTWYTRTQTETSGKDPI